LSDITIRREVPEDRDAVRNINLRAFGQATEGNIVDALRTSCLEALSLVGVEDHCVVGHILFTPVTIDGLPIAGGMGLAPMSVLPEKQRLGIGSKLVRSGLDQLRNAGCLFVVVLGHPSYYPRFGFTPASQLGLSCQWPDVPDDAFMILVLKQDALTGVQGVVRYRSEFATAMRSTA
jgi:putative acetyltransferase